MRAAAITITFILAVWFLLDRRYGVAGALFVCAVVGAWST